MCKHYIDVSSACESPLNTGIQRVIRNLYAQLKSRHSEQVIPMCWDNQRKGYYKLSQGEFNYLSNPFQGKRTSSSRPRSSTIKKLLHRISNRRWRVESNKVDLSSLNISDIFWMPEIFRDTRLEIIQDSFTPAISVALFYDAISWKHPEFSLGKRSHGFCEYMRALSIFDSIFPISEESKHDLLEFWQSEKIITESEVNTASLPTDEVSSKPKQSEAARNNPPKILSVGTLELRKNYPALLEACESLWSSDHNFELAIIGRELKGQSEKVIQQINQLIAMNRPIQWLKHVDDDTLAENYSNCRFTVFPSLKEGYGLPIIESLRYNKPCICNMDGAIAETAAGGGTLTLNTNNPKDLAQGIQTLLNKEDFYQQKIEEIKTRSFKTWEVYLNELESSLESNKIPRSTLKS